MKKIILVILALSCLISVQVNAQYSVLLTFNGINGQYPRGALTFSGNTLFGMTFAGGNNNYGCLFSIDTNGNNYVARMSFNGNRGQSPIGSLLPLRKKLYGMASGGGAFANGCIFSIDTTGSGYVNMHSFNANDGGSPYGDLVLYGKKFYGMTAWGGTHNDGVIFSIDTNGSGYTVLFNFNMATDGYFPEGNLSISNGIMYGMTSMGGPAHLGNIFAIDTNGTGYRNFMNFTGANGKYAYGSLTLVGNKLYGMTDSGGTHNLGRIFSIDTNGTGYTDLFDFSGANGQCPNGSLLYSSGKLYGTTLSGGAFTKGNVFCIDTNGVGFNDLLDFNGHPDGSSPYGNLIISGSTLYGMTEGGAWNYDGEVFKLTPIIAGNNAITKRNEGVNIFPNPSKGKFIIELTGMTGNNTVEIYSSLGRLVFSGKLAAANSEIDLQGCSTGIYLYRILNNQREQVYTGKFLVE